MATLPLASQSARSGQAPFFFNTAAHLLRICRERAATLGELLEALRTCPDDSIFQHTFRTLEEHHFIREGFSNDFAHWAFSACNEVALAERLASLDIREFTSVSALRETIVKIVSDHLNEHPRARDRAALEPFYFCATDLVIIPTTLVARTLEEFMAGMEIVSLHSVHYHFIEARLRLKLTTNDFSQWLASELHRSDLAEAVNRIDIYTATLDEVRLQIIQTVRAAL